MAGFRVLAVALAVLTFSATVSANCDILEECPDGQYFDCRWQACRCNAKLRFQIDPTDKTKCIPICPLKSDPTKPDLTQVAVYHKDTKTYTCKCRNSLATLTDGVCVKPCRTVGQPCDDKQLCCTGNVCNNQGQCAPVPGAQACPNHANKVCVDVASSPGQATCGDPTCKAVCNAVCGDSFDYKAKDCSNKGGGNCQGVFSLFPPYPDFHGGPCCGCKACHKR